MFRRKKSRAAVKPGESAGFATAWRLTTFALVFVGFFALATTGEIHPVAIGLFVASWLFGILSSGSPRWWRSWMAYPLTWVPLTVITIIVLLGRFESLLYLLMFLGLYKCNTLRDPGDHMQALIMAFFMLLACTIITHSASYLGFVTLFLMLATLDLCFMTIARESERSSVAPAKPGAPAPRGVGLRLVWDAVAYGFFMLLLGYFIFLVMPHYSLESRFGQASFTPPVRESAEAVSGYDDELTLKNLNNINLDERRVLDIRLKWIPEGTSLPLPTALWVRGMVLNQFDGERWSQAAQLGNEWVSDRWEEVNFAEPSGVLLAQEIHQDIGQVERLFAVPMPVQFYDLPHGYSVQMNYLTWGLKLGRYPDFARRRRVEVKYRAVSQVQPDASQILEAASRRGLKAPQSENKWLTPNEYKALVHRFDRRDSPRLSDAEIRINTQLPSDPITDVVFALSHEHMTASTDADKILLLLNWMRDNFEYTLQPGMGDTRRPLERFLTQTRRGHCEYFASAFVLLLRAQRIPARVALGFYTSEFDPISKSFIVRQSDAHAWAEVWLNDYGWITVDPTPPTHRGRSSVLLERASIWARFSGVMRQLWRQYVLDYSTAEQFTLMRNLASSRVGRAVERALRSIKDTLSSHISIPETSGSHVSDWVKLALWLLVPVMILMALIALGVLVAQRFWTRRKLARIYRSPVEFMNSLLAVLQSRGWRRRPDQTIAEFARQVETETAGAIKLGPIVEIYLKCRFAGEELTTKEEAAVRETIRRIQNAKLN